MRKSKITAVLPKLIAFVISLVLSVIMVEAGFRVYLRESLTRKELAKIEHDPAPTFRMIAYPPPWIYNRAYGWDFTPGGWRGAVITKGVFERCMVIPGFNARGNIGSRDTDLNNARPLVLAFGSSFTMTHDENGAMATELLEDRLKSRFPSIHVENVARDSSGILQMFDMAALKARELKPAFMLFLFNTSDLSRPRHWRSVVPTQGGFYRFYQTTEADLSDFRPQSTVLNGNIVISDRLTPAWCESMEAAAAAKSRSTEEDPLIRSAVVEYNKNRQAQAVSRFAIDFTTLRVSFVWNALWHGAPFHDMDVFDGSSPLGPIRIENFGDDKEFVRAVDDVRASNIPFYLIHIPAYPEMRDGIEFAHGAFGVTAERESRLVKSLEEITQKKILSLLPTMGAPLRNAADYVYSAGPESPDWHPNANGTRLLAESLYRLISAQLLPEIATQQ